MSEENKSPEQFEQRSIPFDRLETNTCGFHNPRTYLGDVRDLKGSILSVGLTDPPIVWETNQRGKIHYVVLKGHRRHECLRQIRQDAADAGTPETAMPFEDVSCSVYTGDLDGAIRLGLIGHVQRETLNVADTAQAVYHLLERDSNQAQVAKVLNKSQPWVSIMFNLYKGLIPEALEAMRKTDHENKPLINLNQGKKLAQMLNPDRTPNREAQLAELDRLLNKGKPEEAAEGELPVPEAPERQRTKTHRTKGEVEKLRASLAEARKNDPELDAEYREFLSNFIKWYFCEVDSESIMSSATSGLNLPSDDTNTEVVQPAAPKKRRIADVVAA